MADIPTHMERETIHVLPNTTRKSISRFSNAPCQIQGTKIVKIFSLADHMVW